MPTWKVGDRVKVVSKQPTMEDKLGNHYFEHMGGLTGSVEAVYSKDEVAVKVDQDSFGSVLAGVHKNAVNRMRAKFIDSLGEEQKRRLSEAEKKFNANYVLLVRSSDLEKGPKASDAAPAAPESEEDPEEYRGTNVRDDIIYDDQSIPDSSRRSLSDYEEAEAAELNRRKKS